LANFHGRIREHSIPRNFFVVIIIIVGIIGIKGLSVLREADIFPGGKSGGLNAGVREGCKWKTPFLLLTAHGCHWNQVFCSLERLYRLRKEGRVRETLCES
jgi:hypothetical protein